MARENSQPRNMAEDTRLADACLLLNFPNQSYREQQILSEQSRAKDHHQQDTPESSDTSDDQQASGNESLYSVANPNANSSSKLSSPKEPTLKRSHDEATEDNRLVHQNSNDCVGRTRDPISNLLAAVNCALPGLRTLPKILQRSATFNLSPKSQYAASLPSPPDHDYCRKSPSIVDDLIRPTSINSTNGTETPVNREPSSSCDDTKYANTETNDQKRPLKVVAVHLGAGSGGTNPELLKFAKSICEQVMLKDSAESEYRTIRRKRKQACNSSNLDGPDKKCECQTIPSTHAKMTAEEAVVQLVRLMEDNQALNCGLGSNLNIHGQVECDASLMSDRHCMWAGVGAVSGCRNPILLAKSLYDHRDIRRPMSLIQPNFLVGSGAKQWMREHCPNLSVMDSKMLSSKSFSTYQKLKSNYDAFIRSVASDASCPELKQNSPESNRARSPIGEAANIIIKQETHSCRQHPSNFDHSLYCQTNKNKSDNTDSGWSLKQEPSLDKKTDSSETECNSLNNQQRLDTVGAVAVDCDDNFACAISSGGLLLKYKGRVGQAAVPGAGCWAENSAAATSTGVGEYLTQTLFAKKFHDKLQSLRLLYDLGHVETNSDLVGLVSCCMKETFEDLLNSAMLNGVPARERLAGMLSICSFNTKTSPIRVSDSDLYLTYAHNTNSMCIGYMTCDDILGHSLISTREETGVRKQDDGKPQVKTLRLTSGRKVPRLVNDATAECC